MGMSPCREPSSSDSSEVCKEGLVERLMEDKLSDGGLIMKLVFLGLGIRTSLPIDSLRSSSSRSLIALGLKVLLDSRASKWLG